jgi:putative methionine-R-sulfoxide reductase with GAF domain
MDVSPLVPSQVIFKREQDASEAVPLTYREYVYVVPPGTTETIAETLLQTQLQLVQTSLERVTAGKLVNLAVFDVVFQGKPRVPPLATLMWKDWRGAAVVTFPRSVPAHGAAPLAAATPIRAQVAPEPPPQPALAPTPIAAPVIAAPVIAAPVIAAPVIAAPVIAAPVVAAAVPATNPLVSANPLFPVAPAPQAQPAAAPARAGSSARWNAVAQPDGRIRGEDLIADLFEAMHDLHFLRDAVEGGDFCLALALEKLPSHAGIVHLYDIDHREFIVTNTYGAAARELLLQRFPEGDPMLAAAMRKRSAVVIANAAESEATTIDRYVVLGGARSLIVAPVMQSGRFLGAIELLNPLDGQPFTEIEGNALTYIGEQLAEFVATRGIVTDPERISAGK